jgi:hypothetical protein
METLLTLSEKQIELLLSPLPKEALTKHPTKTYLTSIKPMYIIERLNDVFGIGSWSQKVNKESVSANGMVVVKVIFEVQKYGIYHESFGGNDNGGENSKNFDLGDAYKGASTDALTKIASYLGIGSAVFKGMQNNITQNTNKPTTPNANDKPKQPAELKELIKDSDDWNNAINYINSGKLIDIKQLTSKFTISPTLLPTIQALILKAKNGKD